MEDFTVEEAKERLEELIARAARGEQVRIVAPRLGKVLLRPIGDRNVSDTPRATDTMEPFVPLTRPRRLGLLQGRIPPPPDDFFAPLSDEELKEWYGEE